MTIDIGDSTATVRTKINALLADAGLDPADNVDTTAATTLLNQVADLWAVPVTFTDAMPEADFRAAFALLESGEVSPNLYDRPGTSSRKIIAQNTDVIYIGSKKDDGVSGFVAREVRRNNFIVTDSIGTPSETWRPCQEFELEDAFVLNNTETGTSGTWSTGTLNVTNNPTGYVSNTTLRSVPAMWSQTNGGLKEFLVAVDANGKFNVVLQKRTGTTTPSGSTGQASGSPSVNIIDIDGSVTVATIDLSTGGWGLYVPEFTHPTKRSTTFTCRIQKASGDGTTRLCIVGVNAVLLSQPTLAAPSLASYSFDTYVRTANTYVTTQGAQDKAASITGSALTGGSAHGGETLNSIAATLDGAAYTMGTRAVGNELIVTQASTITDASVSKSWTSTMVSNYGYDGRERHLIGVVTANSLQPFYTGMGKIAVGFKRVSVPFAIADTTSGTGTGDSVDAYPLGQATGVMQHNDATGQVYEYYSSAPVDIPSYDATILTYDLTNGYQAARSIAAKGTSTAAGSYSFKVAHSFK